MTRLVAAVVAAAILAGDPPPARGELTPGTMIDQSTAGQVRDLLPPEIHKHYQNGDYRNPVVDFPAGRFRWDDGFDQATRQNGERLTLDASKQPVDSASMQRPDYLTGIPFPQIGEGDPDGGYKVLWNLAYAYFNATERWYGSTQAFQGSENVKADRATVSGMSGPGDDPANDRRIPLEPSFFDYQTLNRFGK